MTVIIVKGMDRQPWGSGAEDYDRGGGGGWRGNRGQRVNNGFHGNRRSHTVKSCRKILRKSSGSWFPAQFHKNTDFLLQSSPVLLLPVK